MTTSAKTSLNSVACLDDVQIGPFELGYLIAAAKDQAYETVLRTFLDQSAADPRITRAFMARRAGKTPEQITRYLGSPGNWTLETLAVLLAAIGYKATIGAEKISDLRLSNECHPLALNEPRFSTGHASSGPATVRQSKVTMMQTAA